MASTSTADISTRFLFSEADIRGELVSLGVAYREMLGDHGYSASVAALIGEFAVAAILISNNLKYRGRIILQARGEGPLSLLMVECSSDREIRGIARGDTGYQCERPLDLIVNGQLALTIEREGGQRYQGIVALDGANLAAALNEYFLQSEQLHTEFVLAADGERAAGLMLQQLPAQIAQRAADRDDQWQTARILAETLESEELLDLAPGAILHRLYHEQDLQVFAPETITFRCRCTRQRSLDALSLLPTEELEAALAESGEISMTCEMCGMVYRFDRAALPTLAEQRILH